MCSRTRCIINGSRCSFFSKVFIRRSAIGYVSGNSRSSVFHRRPVSDPFAVRRVVSSSNCLASLSSSDSNFSVGVITPQFLECEVVSQLFVRVVGGRLCGSVKVDSNSWYGVCRRTTIDSPSQTAFGCNKIVWSSFTQL